MKATLSSRRESSGATFRAQSGSGVLWARWSAAAAVCGLALLDALEADGRVEYTDDVFLFGAHTPCGHEPAVENALDLIGNTLQGISWA
jgi:hypothetical protein